MIQWADTVDRWADRWLARWAAESHSRQVISATVRLDGATPAEPVLIRVPLPARGGRLVLVVTAHHRTLAAGGDWLAALESRDLTPEVPHLCQPLPGSPSFSAGWLDRHAAVQDGGYATVGLVLGRRFDCTTLRTTRFGTVDRPIRPAPYYPLPPGRSLPLPLRGTALTADDIAGAFRVSVADCRVLIEELVWSGDLAINRSSGPRRPGDPP